MTKIPRLLFPDSLPPSLYIYTIFPFFFFPKHTPNFFPKNVFQTRKSFFPCPFPSPSNPIHFLESLVFSPLLFLHHTVTHGPHLNSLKIVTKIVCHCCCCCFSFAQQWQKFWRLVKPPLFAPLLSIDFFGWNFWNSVFPPRSTKPSLSLSLCAMKNS